ncbi:altronate oxidoreductase [Vibrio sp. HA2012]|uniref:tagaturonate reductase n=1 Tax=Vibrio sp. HA2012 TaxID=1971595 RepID=UPI000C2C5008|nr:tagaturonate reductase [Vibrio sp. HA2012]PJC85620.1 altronate oxidoreductase [Vibrio sp. HA2012]
MKTLNRTDFNQPQYTTRILQFGEGNFLRAFVDWQIDLLNQHTDLDAGIAIVRPIDTDFPPLLNEQDGLYTSVIRGINEQNQAVEELRVIASVNQEIPVYKDMDAYLQLAKDPNIQFIFSNTTEAGIAFNAEDTFTARPAGTFPAKLTQWLHARFTEFDADPSKGLFIIPCELIDYNGDKLKEIINQYIDLWMLGDAFKHWVNDANIFCSTLVDRIVTGHPRDELSSLEEKAGYRDQFMVTAEYFYLFVIQGPKQLAEALHLEGQDLNIRIVDDIKPYKERKVAILNGAHTAMVPVAFMAGIDTVGEAMDDAQLSQFVDQLLREEVIPALSLPEEELTEFAESVVKRFKNPYIKHQLLSIALNSMTKWCTRLLPQLLVNAERNSAAPNLMSLALAAQFLLYSGIRDGELITLSDEQEWLDFFATQWEKHGSQKCTTAELVTAALQNSKHWGMDLNTVPELHAKVTGYLEQMLSSGVRSVLNEALGK